MKVSIRQLGPGMIQQMQHVCPDCKGSGLYLSWLCFLTAILDFSLVCCHWCSCHIFDKGGAFMVVCFLQEKWFMKKTSAHNARDRRLCKTRRCWKFILRRGCKMDKRSPSKEKQMRRYDVISLVLIDYTEAWRCSNTLKHIFCMFDIYLIVCWEVQLPKYCSALVLQFIVCSMVIHNITMRASQFVADEARCIISPSHFWSGLTFFAMLQPDTQTGDIVFVLQQKEHPKFKRKGDDLFVERTLTLTEALCGFHFALSHLDGRQLLIKTIPGEIIKPGLFSLLFRLSAITI